MRTFAQSLMSLPGDAQLQQLQAIESQNPELGEMLRQAMAQIGGGQSNSGTPGPGQVDMRPLPKVLPQRRAQPA